MISRRLLECIAMMMIGDGALALLDPRRHMKLWQSGPRPWEAMLRPFVKYPVLTRWGGIAELAAGLWLAQKQRPEPRRVV